MPQFLSRAFFALVITTVTAVGADNSLGTWKLNQEQSKYTPAPFPIKSLTSVRESSGGGVKVTVTGERSNGARINTQYTTKYDGAAAAVSGEGLLYDSIAVKQVNANTFTDERKNSGGSYKATGRIVISNGGKTMTVTTKGTNSEGKAFTSTLVFEKQ
jgi:hypothetical protein